MSVQQCRQRHAHLLSLYIRQFHKNKTCGMELIMYYTFVVERQFRSVTANTINQNYFFHFGYFIFMELPSKSCMIIPFSCMNPLK